MGPDERGGTGMLGKRSAERSAVREVLVVDGDVAIRESLARLLSHDGIIVTAVPDGAACLDRVAGRIPSAIVLNIGVSREADLEVLRGLKASHCPSPVVVVSVAPTIRLAVEAMKCGATDFFERPCETDSLIGCLRATVAAAERQLAPRDRRTPDRNGAWREQLTPRESEVVVQITSGASNKEVGRLLGISPRTVEVHRARIMEKLSARNAADLVRIVLSDRH